MSLFSPRRKLWGVGRSSGPRRRAQRLGQQKLGLEALESRLAPATSIWTGAVDGLWSTAANWDAPPVAGSDLVFPTGASNLANTNDLAAGTSFASLTVSGSGYTIGGAAIALDGVLDASLAAGTGTINLPINLTGAATIEVDESGAVLVLGGVLSGSNGLSKAGAGELDLTADNAYTGTTSVLGGVLVVGGAQGGSPIALSAGTALQGSGTVGSIAATSGTVSPGGATPAILTTGGDLTLDAASTFAVDLNGNTAGSGYDQLAVGGLVNLAGAALQPTLNGYTPAKTDQLVILDNTGSAAITGTFAGLPQGATVEVAGEPFQISYTGGDGNDVVLSPVLDSTTTLVASPTSSVFGQSVSLTATVAATDPGATDTPTGTVEFFSGTTSLGTATLNAGVAILNTPALPVGSDPVTAQYKGDVNFASSTSAASTVTVAQASTTTTLSASLTSAVFGQVVTLNATVAPVSPGAGTPTGTVEFFSGTTSLGTGTLANGIATLSTTTLPVGSNSITAQFQGGASYTTSTSSAVVTTVTQTNTTITLTSSPNPSSVGQSTILTATVAAVNPGSGTPTGTVEFFSGGASLGTGTLNGGVATLDTSNLPLGTSTITAQYQGDGNYVSSASSTLTQTVSPASTTTLTTSSVSINFGEQVTLTATVTGVASGSGTPTGNVIFMSGTTPVGTAALNNGVAKLESSNLPGGANSITAQYQGDTHFGGSTSAAVSVTVAKASTTSTLVNSPNPSGFGSLVTFKVTIGSSSTSTVKPSGTVQFFDGTTLIGTATAVDGVATLTTSSLTLGTHSITAQYPGDSNYEASTSTAVTQTVNQASTTTLAATPTSAVFGQTVELKATVTASTSSGIPTGSVEFFRNSVSLGKATLVDGVATLSISAGLVTGSNLVTATYAGDSNFGVSNSTSITVTVAKANTTTTLTVVPNPSGFSQEVTLTATVTATGPGSGTPTGPVQFSSGTTVLGIANLVNGVATLTTTALPLGASPITARYASDTNFRTSTSDAITATVSQSNSAVTVTSSIPNPSAYEAVTLTATVAASNSGTGSPTGTVQFFTNGRLLGSATLTNGRATLITTGLAVGGNTVTAVYQGDSNFSTATSPGLSVVTGTQTEQFLNQVYVNATGRPATLDELDFYRTQLAVGIPRKRVVTRIVTSLGGQTNAVQTVYRTFLRREATHREVLRGLTQTGKTQGFAVEIQVLGSREYYQAQGGGTIDGYLTALSQDVLGTDLSNQSRNRLTQRLRQGASRSSIAQSLVLSQPGKTAFVGFLYQQFFDTTPTSQQSARSVGLLNRGGRVDQVVIDLLSSNDFFNQFGGNA